MKLYSFLFLFIMTIALQAQHTIKGTITDTSNGIIPFANVTLSKEGQQEHFKGTTSDQDGFFELQNIPTGDYQLQVSFIGFKSHTSSISITKNTQLPSIILYEESEALSEVVITAKKPTVARKVDRLVFNVANTTISSGNAWEILKNTPGVVIRQDALSIKNSTNIIVLINDKRTYLSSTELKDLLEGTSGNEITAVEVITNPPAKYEAEGSAVLNIKMKNNRVEGYKGTISSRFQQAVFPKWLWGTSHYYKTKKINLYANYTYSHRKDNRVEDEFIMFTNPEQQFESHLDRNSWSRSHNFKLNTDITLSKNSTLTLASQLFYSPNWSAKNTTRSNVFDANQVLTSSFDTFNEADNFTKNLGLDLDYTLKLKEEGEKLTVKAHYTDYDKNGNQEVTTLFFSPEGNFESTLGFTTFSDQKTNIYSGQLDYVLPFSETTKFEAGVKYASVNSESDLSHFNILDDSPIIDLTKSNSFLYDEKNIASYLSYETTLGKFNIKSGLRAEYTDLKGTSLTLDQTNTSKYLKVFPTFYMQYSPNDMHQLGISYGKRIRRPQYSSLNPFKFYFGNYSFYEGNPALRPTIIHNIDLQYTIVNKYNFDLYYSYHDDYITETNFQDNTENTLRFTNINVAKKIGYGINFNTNINITDRWSIYTVHSAFYNEDVFNALENNNTLVTNSRWGYYGYLSSNYQFLKDKSLTAEISGYVVTPGIQGALVVEGSQDLSIGITKKLLNDKLTLSLRATDLLNSQIVKIQTQYLDQNNFFIDNQETQTIQIGLRYNFGNQSLKKGKQSSKTAEQKRL